jgi:hypothetical protein
MGNHARFVVVAVVVMVVVQSHIKGPFSTRNTSQSNAAD